MDYIHSKLLYRISVILSSTLGERFEMKIGSYLIDSPGTALIRKTSQGYVLTYSLEDFDFSIWASERFTPNDWEVKEVFEEQIYNVAVSDRVVTYLLTSSE